MDYTLSIINELKAKASPEKAKIMSAFFKTGEGEYAAGDIFWGMTAKEQRDIVKKYYSLISLKEISDLLGSPVHEQRFVGLQCLVSKYNKADKAGQNEIIEFYLENAAAVNNWDLVDTTAPHLLGAWSYAENTTDKIWELARSQQLWMERIAIVATLYWIRKGNDKPAIDLAEFFLTHRHDLIHKAAGWMLREVGKRREKALTDFLDKYAKKMPRTMLRYAIERLTTVQRRLYMMK